MKVTPDDPVLTAYVLGELEEKDRSSVERALSADEALREEETAISSLTGLLSATLGGEVLSLGEERIAEIHRAGKRPDSETLVLAHHKRSRRHSLVAVAGVAAAVVVGLVVLSQFDVSGKNPVAGNEVGGTTSDGGDAIVPAGDSPDLPGEYCPEVAGTVRIPLGVDRADASFVQRSLEKSDCLPERDRFLVADWIQLGAPATGDGTEFDGVAVWYELGPCSWNPSASLLMVRLDVSEGRPVKVSASLTMNPSRVKVVRLVGGAGKDATTSAVSVTLKEARTFLYELDLEEGKGELGQLKIKVGESPERSLSLEGVLHNQSQLSSAFATAGILGDYARWGASEERDRETLVRLSQRAKALLEEVVYESTRYALDMILMSEEALEKP